MSPILLSEVDMGTTSFPSPITVHFDASVVCEHNNLELSPAFVNVFGALRADPRHKIVIRSPSKDSLDAVEGLVRNAFKPLSIIYASFGTHTSTKPCHQLKVFRAKKGTLTQTTCDPDAMVKIFNSRQIWFVLDSGTAAPFIPCNRDQRRYVYFNAEGDFDPIVSTLGVACINTVVLGEVPSHYFVSYLSKLPEIIGGKPLFGWASSVGKIDAFMLLGGAFVLAIAFFGLRNPIE